MKIVKTKTLKQICGVSRFEDRVKNEYIDGEGLGVMDVAGNARENRFKDGLDFKKQ